MKDWFKARNVWGATILALSDDEAGKIAKAIWAYTMNGELVPLEGAAKGIFPMILMTLQQDEERESDISAKRSSAARNMHLQTNANKSNQMLTNDNKSDQLTAIDDNKNKNQNKSKNQNKESDIKVCRFTPPTPEDVAEYCRERGNSVDAERFCDFYASKGWKVGSQPMKDWKAAVRTWEKDNKVKPVQRLQAQSYEQRDYSSEQDTAIERMMQMGGLTG